MENFWLSDFLMFFSILKKILLDDFQNSVKSVRIFGSDLNFGRDPIPRIRGNKRDDIYTTDILQGSLFKFEII